MFASCFLPSPADCAMAVAQDTRELLKMGRKVDFRLNRTAYWAIVRPILFIHAEQQTNVWPQRWWVRACRAALMMSAGMASRGMRSGGMISAALKFGFVTSEAAPIGTLRLWQLVGSKISVSVLAAQVPRGPGHTLPSSHWV